MTKLRLKFLLALLFGLTLANSAYALKVEQMTKQISAFKTLRSFLMVATHGLDEIEQTALLAEFTDKELDAKVPLKAMGSKLLLDGNKDAIAVGIDAKSIEYRNLIFRYDPKQNFTSQIHSIAKHLRQLSPSGEAAGNLWFQLLMPEAFAKSSASSKVSSSTDEELHTAFFIGASLRTIYQYQDIGSSYMDSESSDLEHQDPVATAVRLMIGKKKKLKDIVCVQNPRGYGIVLLFQDGSQTEIDVVRNSSGRIDGVMWTDSGTHKSLDNMAASYWEHCQSKKAQRSQALDKIRKGQDHLGTQ